MSYSSRLDWLLVRRVGLLGYGRDGQAAARAILARNSAADLTVLVEDGEPETALPVQIGRFGRGLKAFDALVRSPGVPVDHPALAAARESGVAVVSPASIWLAERGRTMTVVGVTGSKGKSTTASLFAHVLRHAGRDVLLAGNIGVPLLDHLDTKAEIAVLELSSYQLADLEGGLDLGLLTRLFPEHLDWHGSEAAYVAAKLRLADLLAGRPLLINADDELLELATRDTPGRVLANRAPTVAREGNHLWFEGRSLCHPGTLPLIGQHNLDNAALALQAAIMLGHEADVLAAGLAGFQPLPHRLESIATIAGVRYVNDSIATSPWATLAALQALDDTPVILLAGGQPRPTDWQPVLEWVAAHGLAALLSIPDNGSDIARRFADTVADRVGRIEALESLEQAVARASELAPEGGVVLLSPGAPSFTRFRDFEERGECFRRAVAAL